MFKLQLFGAVELRDSDDRPVHSVVAQPKRLALLAYLALHGGFCRRDTLLPLFWPQQDQEHARAALRKVIHLLRRSLGPEVIVGRGDEEVCLGEESLWCDVRAFRLAVQRGEAEMAMGLYRGDLLPGFFLDEVPEFERWLDAERERLHLEAARIADALAEAAESRGEVGQAVHWARRRLALNAVDEDALRRLVRLLERAGDRTGALTAYEHFSLQLKLGYDLEPSAETRALVEELRRPSTPPPLSHAGEPAPAPDPVRLPAAGSSAGGREAAVGVAFRMGGRDGSVWRRWRTHPRRARGVVVAGLLAGGILFAPEGVAFLIREAAATRGEAPAHVEQASIAVLPIVDVAPEGRAEYFGDGLTDELINALGRIPGLRVSSRTSSFAWKDARVDVREVGKRLGVQFVLEGSLRKNGDQLRLSIQLIDVSDGHQRWAQSYDRRMPDVFAVQAEITEDVVRAIQRPLALRAAGEGRHGTSDPAAYDDYLRGRFLMQHRTRERVEGAIRHFSAAAAKDSAYALPYAGLAEAYLAMSEWVNPKDVLPRAKASAERALQLNDELVEPHLALANLLFHYEWDWSGAEREYRRALQLAPKLPAAHYSYASFLTASRRFPEMVRAVERGLAFERAEAVDTVAFALQRHVRLSCAYFDARRYPEAIAQAERALDLDPDAPVRVQLALASQLMGDHARAVEEIEELGRLRGNDSGYLELLGGTYARAGRRQEAMAVLATLLRRLQTEDEYVAKDRIAGIYLGLGNFDQAIRWYEASINDRHWFAVYRNSDPLAESLRENPRFRGLLRTINAPEAGPPQPVSLPLAAR